MRVHIDIRYSDVHRLRGRVKNCQVRSSQFGIQTPLLYVTEGYENISIQVKEGSECIQRIMITHIHCIAADYTESVS